MLVSSMIAGLATMLGFTSFKQKKQEQQLPLREPSVEGLIYALENLHDVKPNFHWDYKHVNTCAVGLTQALWPHTGVIRNTHQSIFIRNTRQSICSGMSRALGIQQISDVGAICFELESIMGKEHISPHDVARRLKKLPKVTA